MMIYPQILTSYLEYFLSEGYTKLYINITIDNKSGIDLYYGYIYTTLPEDPKYQLAKNNQITFCSFGLDLQYTVDILKQYNCILFATIANYFG